LIPKDAANHKIGHCIEVESPRKDKKIDPVSTAHFASFERSFAQLFRPIWPGKVNRLVNVCVAATAYHQKVSMCLAEKGKRQNEIRSKNDVAIDVAEDFVTRILLRRVKKRAKDLGTLRHALNLRNVPNVKVSSDFRSPFVVTEENNLNVRMKKFPAAERIALNYGVVPKKRLGSSEQGEHFSYVVELA